VLPSISPTVAVQVTSTPTRTPTPVGPALAEALEGPTNVRAAPDLTGELLGQINPGDVYPVLGRAAGTLWLKIQYPDSPTGTAWVFEQVVSLTGDVENIPELNASSEPTLDVNAAAATQTIEALAQTPGALETATIVAIFSVAVNGETPTPSNTPGPLPTFTSPPGSVAQATSAAPVTSLPTIEVGGLPPIIPIAVLGALGILGLLVALVRRVG
jgi:hypothetical protein